MGSFLRIRCLVPTSVMIEDMQVRLAGKGNEVTVLTSVAEASRDLRECLRLNQVTLLRVGPTVWPVAGPVVLPPLPLVSGPSVAPPRPSSPVSPAAPPPRPPSSPDFMRLLGSIDEKLGALLLRPSATPPEAVAAQARAIVEAFSSPSSSSSPSPSSHPQFIPSVILPSEPGAGSSIKVSKSEASVGVEASVSALKELRKKK